VLKIQFKGQKMLLANVNVRAEVHGDDREPAGDLKFEVDLDNGFLGEFHPALKSTLYHFDESRERDLADQGKRHDAPDLRMPQLQAPLKWDEEMLGAKCRIREIGAKSDVGLDPVRVNNWTIEPREGGTCSVSFRVQCHPDEKIFGKLAMLVQQEVEVTLEAASGN
jgi:hypothetical protein